MNCASELAAFFSRLDRFQIQRKAEKIHCLSRGLQRISAELPRFRQHAMHYEAVYSPKFNVYRILRLEGKEVLVHTPILANLLDPNGTHGQGFLFLKNFFHLLKSPPSSQPEQFRWFVYREKHTGRYGIIDLVVTCPELRYALAIENKIGSGEQRDQIWRYWSWLREKRKRFTEHHLVFLTPTGRDSTSARDAIYTKLSYHKDIHSWLGGLLPEIKSAAVRESVNQYLQIIENS